MKIVGIIYFLPSLLIKFTKICRVFVIIWLLSCAIIGKILSLLLVPYATLFLVIEIISYVFLSAMIIFLLYHFYISAYVPFQDFKPYNKICISQWRNELLELGFVENFDGYSNIPNLYEKQFLLQGIYENIIIEIKSSGENAEMIEISIPLIFEEDENFELLQSNFTTNYPTQKIIFSKEKLYKTISINEVVEDRVVWETINQLIMVVKEQNYPHILLLIMNEELEQE